MHATGCAGCAEDSCRMAMTELACGQSWSELSALNTRLNSFTKMHMHGKATNGRRYICLLPSSVTASPDCSMHCALCCGGRPEGADVTFTTWWIRSSSTCKAICLLNALSRVAVDCSICSISTSYSPAVSCRLLLFSAPLLLRCLMTCTSTSRYQAISIFETQLAHKTLGVPW